MGYTLSATFRGVRGSHPVCGAEFLRTGGNTTCLEVRAAGRTLIIDAGTGIIPLGQALAAAGAPAPLTLLVTHTHYDHTMGFPFFAPAYRPSGLLHLYGPSSVDQSFQEILTEAMVPPFFPVRLAEMPATKVMKTLTERQEIVFCQGESVPTLVVEGGPRPADEVVDVRVRVHRSLAHPTTGCFVYRIECGGKSLVFATDVEGYLGGDRRLIAFASGADLLVHDAQYTEEEYLSAPRQGWGHSTFAMAADVARAAGVGRLVLTHHDPARTDDQVDAIESAARRLFPATDCAREGKSVEL